MADMTRATLEMPLEGERFSNRSVSLEVAPPAARLALRATEAGRITVREHLGFDLPNHPAASAMSGSRTALWLGPDEWLIIDSGDADAKLAPETSDGTFSSVDVSHRNCGFTIDGPAAADVLNSACPRDLRDAAFPVGACSRTVFGKAEIVLHRQAEQRYHVEVWRSFAPYVWELLRVSAIEER